MKSTGRTLTIIGSVIGFISALILLIFSIIAFSAGAISGNAELMGGEAFSAEDQAAAGFGGALIGTVLLILALSNIVAGILKIIAVSKGKKPLLITAIVFSALGGEILGLVGSILCLVDASKNPAPIVNQN